MQTLAVIPARYASTRLPGKPLVDLGGKPMICRVLEKVMQAKYIDDVVVATDDQRIVEAVEACGGKAMLTSKNCASGTDRLQEVARKISADIYLNVQGDEPLLDPTALERLVLAMQEEKCGVATLAYRIDGKQAKDPNLVKVVCDHRGFALYFSRSPIPFVRDQGQDCFYFAHLGVYGYSKEVLQQFGQLPKSPLEELEKLEQLRLMQAGIPILVLETKAHGIGVDTPEDLEVVRALFEGKTLPTLNDRLRRIKLIVTDVDGVLTDGTLVYGEKGEELKCFHAKDGLGIIQAKRMNLQIAILSGRDCLALRRRLKDLGIGLFRLGQLEKAQALVEILAEADCTPEETC
ncbi:MAG: 3-deoxy-manno-octulosonate cytidylyltransferase, partial [Desulfovibrio sp.]|nr:3-deoxy-manno-octulosonate cytidylyltransferase [Desulfovibrio sp.]